jgi:uncharacterized membrane protein YgcG
MTHHPFDSEELGARDRELETIAGRLERYAAETAGDPRADLTARIRGAVDAQADRRGPLAALLGAQGWPARAFAAAALLAVAVGGAIVVGQLANLAREQIGTSPSPSVIVTPSETPTPTPTDSPTPTPTMSETPSPSPSPTHLPSPSSSSAASPEASDNETPEPSGSDNSGPGGGGGGDDNSGPGGGGSSGSGSGGSGSGGDGSGGA